MASFKLSNGYSVRTTSYGDGTEFETSNPNGEVISNVILYGDDARETLRNLCVAERLAALPC